MLVRLTEHSAMCQTGAKHPISYLIKPTQDPGEVGSTAVTTLWWEAGGQRAEVSHLRGGRTGLCAQTLTPPGSLQTPVLAGDP